MSEIRTVALEAYEHGLCPLPPAEDGSKQPQPRASSWEWKEFQKHRPTLDQLETWWGPRTGVGYVTGKVSGNLEMLEFEDATTFEMYRDTLEGLGLEDIIARVESGYCVATPGGGMHLLYHCETIEGNTELAKRPTLPEERKHERDNVRVLIETRGEGGYTVEAPSNGTVHPTGGQYRQLCGSVSTIATIMPDERAQLFAVARSFDQMPQDEPREQGEPRATTTGKRPGDDYRRRHGTLNTFREIIEAHGWVLVYSRGDVGFFRRPGKKKGVSATFGHAGSDLFYVFSSATDFKAERGYNAFSVYAHLNHAGNFIEAARALGEKGYGEPLPILTAHQTARGTGVPPQEQYDPPFNLSDLGNARRLVRAHGSDLRYCRPFGKWFAWNERHWCEDDTGEVIRHAKATVGSIYTEASNAEDDGERKSLAKHALKTEGEARIHAMIGLAESEPDIPIVPDDLDRHPWLLTVENGTIDLRTGTLGPHRRDHLITKCAPVRFDPDAQCPRWTAFLDSIFAKDSDVISFVKRALGYSLSGSTRERVLFILHGGGRNGKGTLLEVVRDILGPDYSSDTPTDTLLVKRDSGIPNDIAKLRGTRFVTASEVDEGRRLAEATVKKLTGGDMVSARFMRGEFFDFMPAFKLWLGTNHKPDIRGTDRAIWDRLRTIPFGVRFVKPDEEPDAPPHLHADLELRDKLIAEAPGILAWMVEGCLEWQRDGLGYPKAVKDATAGYRAEMDIIGNFLSDCCLVSEAASVTAKDLYGSYTRWCESTGEKPITQTMVGKRLTERGFDSAQVGKSRARTWIGIGLQLETG